MAAATHQLDVLDGYSHGAVVDRRGAASTLDGSRDTPVLSLEDFLCNVHFACR